MENYFIWIRRNTLIGPSNRPKESEGNPSLWGEEQHARYTTKSHGAIAAKHRASEVEIHPGALLTSQPANRSRTYALPASTTALEDNPKNRPRRTAVRGQSWTPSALRHASIGALLASGAIALQGIARLSLAQAPVADGTPGDGRDGASRNE